MGKLNELGSAARFDQSKRRQEEFLEQFKLNGGDMKKTLDSTGITRQLLYAWNRRNPEFKEAIEEASRQLFHPDNVFFKIEAKHENTVVTLSQGYTHGVAQLFDILAKRGAQLNVAVYATRAVEGNVNSHFLIKELSFNWENQQDGRFVFVKKFLENFLRS